MPIEVVAVEVAVEAADRRCIALVVVTPGCRDHGLLGNLWFREFASYSACGDEQDI